MGSTLYNYDKYLDDNIDFLFNHEIIEYDLQRAGLNISRYFKLLPDNDINTIASMPKHYGDVRLGLMQKNDKEFAKLLSEGFKNARKIFFEANELNDFDVLSIKKDAIFLLKGVKYQEFDNLNFRIKNKYTSYIKIGKVEVYYNQGNIDVKGINDEILKDHRLGMLRFFNEYFKMMETDSKENTAKFLREFSEEYRNMELPSEFYREFNANSLYRTNMTLDDKTIYMKDTKDLTRIEIGYNYKNILIPLISSVLV